jgi:hypothetical protein
MNETKSLIARLPYLLKRAVSLDLRSLALYRICLGLIIIIDIAHRITEFDFYTDRGPVPSWLLLHSSSTTSVYFLSNEEILTLFWMLCTMGAALLLILGWKTQVQLIVLYILMSSLHTRNELILDGGDRYFRCILFCSCFLPLGAVYSLDYALIVRSDDIIRRGSHPIEFDYTSWGTCLFLAQIFWLYFTSGLVKTGESWTSGQALDAVLHCDGFISFLALHIRDLLPSLLKTFLTYATVWIETLGGWLLFFKPLSQWFPLLGILSLAGMHMGFIILMELGLFPYMCIVVLIAPLPPMVWRALSGVFERRLRSSERLRLIYVETGSISSNPKEKSLLVLSEGEWTVRLIHTFLLPLTPWHPLNENLATTISSSSSSSFNSLLSSVSSSDDVILSVQDKDLPPLPSLPPHVCWFVLDESGAVLTGRRAWHCVLAHSPFFFWLAPCFRVLSSVSCHPVVLRLFTRTTRLFRQPEYKHTARAVSHILRPTQRTAVWYPSQLLTVLIIALTVYLTWWCLDNLQWLSMPNALKQIAFTLKIDQYWRLFSPVPCSSPMWVVIPATLANGTTLDLYKVYYHPNPPNFVFEWTKPPLAAHTYRSYRWKRYFDHITATNNPVYVQYFLAWTCHRWNANPERPPSERVQSIELSFLEELNDKIVKVHSFQRNCDHSF